MMFWMFLGICFRYLFVIWLVRLGIRKMTGGSGTSIILVIVTGIITFALSSSVGVDFNHDAESWAVLIAMVTFIIRDRIKNKSHKVQSGEPIGGIAVASSDVRAVPGGYDLGDVVLNFMAYTKDFLIYRVGLTEKQADIQMCDPTFGQDVDHAKSQWADEIDKHDEDPDHVLVGRHFDHIRMKSINHVLTKYGVSYAEREAKILDYLKSVGHPLGEKE